MALTLEVDGKIWTNPSAEEIARGFASIEPTTGFSKSLSLVELIRDEDNRITVSGHPIEGWFSLIHQIAGIDYCAYHPQGLSQTKVVQLFQDYSRGDESWQSEFSWEKISRKWKEIIPRIALYALVSVMIYLVVRFILNL